MARDNLVRLDEKNRAILHDRVKSGQVYEISVDENGTVTLTLKEDE